MQRVIDLAHQKKILQAKDLGSFGLSHSYLRSAVRQGILIQVSRGLYIPADADFGEKLDFAIVAKRAPKAIFCLISALRFHNLTTQLASDVWIAISSSAHTPIIDYPPVRTVYMPKKCLDLGIERHVVETIPIQVYSVAKTVVDCFRFMDLVGMDVALESLEEALREARCNRAELLQFAKLCGVEKVVQESMGSVSK